MISNVCPEDEFVSGFRAYTHPVPDLGLCISSPVDQAMQGMETAAAQNDPETPCRGSAVKGTCSVEGFTLKRNKMLSPWYLQAKGSVLQGAERPPLLQKSVGFKELSTSWDQAANVQGLDSLLCPARHEPTVWQ